MQLWAALALHSLILIVILRIVWCHYDRKMPVNSAAVVECGVETIQYYIMLSATYLGNGLTQMPHNGKFVTKGKVT